ncbi:MAG: hypothetical protein ABJQ93_13710 [Luteolibacter sp.]
MAAASAFAAGNVMAGPAPTYTQPAPAADNGFDGALHAGYHTKYIFRGIELGDDLVDVGVDLGTSVAGYDLSAGAWYGSWKANAPNTRTGNELNTDELDIYGEVSRDLGFATVAVGYIYYVFPQGNTNNVRNQIDDAQEAYVSVSREFFGLDASLAYFWDIETDNDGYSQLSLNKGIELNQALTLNIGTDFGYLVEEGDFAHATAKVGLDYALTDNATVTVYGAHVWTLSEGGTNAGVSSPSSAVYTGQENEFFAGASVAVSF